MMQDMFQKPWLEPKTKLSASLSWIRRCDQCERLIFWRSIEGVLHQQMFQVTCDIEGFLSDLLHGRAVEYFQGGDDGVDIENGGIG